ncbi:hypothetical protein B0H13DRAFT_1887624 [Mycena leptocephala]|nr:hypothetical protein B0H13DRAFT_1887624 [Mycena leptocephala]
MPSTRAAAQGISKTIAQLAAQDFSDSEDIMDITLHHADDDTESEDDEHESGEEDEDEDDYDEDERDDDDEEVEEDEDDDDPVAVPSKRKRGSNKNAADNTPAPRKIEYTTAVYTSEQLKKPRSSRGAPRPVGNTPAANWSRPGMIERSTARSRWASSREPGPRAPKKSSRKWKKVKADTEARRDPEDGLSEEVVNERRGAGSERKAWWIVRQPPPDLGTLPMGGKKMRPEDGQEDHQRAEAPQAADYSRYPPLWRHARSGRPEYYKRRHGHLGGSVPKGRTVTANRRQSFRPERTSHVGVSRTRNRERYGGIRTSRGKGGRDENGREEIAVDSRSCISETKVSKFEGPRVREL